MPAGVIGKNSHSRDIGTANREEERDEETGWEGFGKCDGKNVVKRIKKVSEKFGGNGSDGLSLHPLPFPAVGRVRGGGVQREFFKILGEG